MMIFVLVLLCLILPARSVVPLGLGKEVFSKACLPGFGSAYEDCYTNFTVMTLDLGDFGKTFDQLSVGSAGADASIEDLKDPTKPLPLSVVTEAVKQSPDFANSPMGYLTKYGYVKGVIAATCNEQQLISKEVIVDAVLTFVVVAGVDKEKMYDTMMLKRCSSPDIYFDADGSVAESSLSLISQGIGENKVKEHRRRKRWAHHKNLRGNIGVDKTLYSYNLNPYTEPSKLQYAFAKRDVAAAFKLWEDAIGGVVKFTDVVPEGENADFNLMFVADKHHGPYNFETERELAHAPYPLTPMHGEVHFREREDWSSNYDTDVNAVNFKWVTTHELGHSLGLEHSTTSGSIMTAWYNRTQESFRSQDVVLDADDTSAIRFLYGDVSARCKTGWTGFEQICYKLELRTTATSWETAAAQCSSYGASLVTIPDDTVNNLVPSKVANGATPYWIGKRSGVPDWDSGRRFGDYKPENSMMRVPKKKERCLIATYSFGAPIWKYVNCGESAKIKNFVCEKAEEEEVVTTAPPQVITSSSMLKGETPETIDVPCQNYVRGAIRRGDYVYIFGTTLYYKYLYTVGAPELKNGYPKKISDDFPDVPRSFTAVVNNPYDGKGIYFIDRSEVYEYKLDGRNFNLDMGALKKTYTTKKKFKTTNYMLGASKFDKDSIFFFAINGEVGKWTRKGKYTKITKWDYFDTSQIKIDAVMPSYYDGFLQFFDGKEYFLMRKSDGKIPKRFKRPTSKDFEKIKFCDILDQLTLEKKEDGHYPDVSPGEALSLDENLARL